MRGFLLLIIKFMAAPITAYRNGKLNMGQPSDPKSHLIAILQTSKSVMLSRFYLDELLPVKLPDGTDGVVGAVIIGGANEAMHNITTRGGVGRIMVSGQPARLLNDAGLNTKAKGGSVFPQLEGGAAGVVFFPAFYSAQTDIRLFWRLYPSSSAYTPTDWKTVTHNEGEATLTTYFDAGVYGIATGVPIEAYAEVLNNEGVTTTSIFNFTIEADSIPVDVTITLVDVVSGGAWLTIETSVVLQADITYYLTWNNGTTGSNDNTMYSGSSIHQAWMPGFDGSVNNIINMFSLEPNPPHTDIQVTNTPYVYSPPSVSGRLDVIEIISSPNYFRFAMVDPGSNIIHFNGSIVITMRIQWFDVSMNPITQTNEDIVVSGAGSIETSESFYQMGQGTPSSYLYWRMIAVVDAGANFVSSFNTGTYRIEGR